MDVREGAVHQEGGRRICQVVMSSDIREEQEGAREWESGNEAWLDRFHDKIARHILSHGYLAGRPRPLNYCAD